MSNLHPAAWTCPPPPNFTAVGWTGTPLDLNSTLTKPLSDSEKNTQIGEPLIPATELTKDAQVL